MPLAVGSMFTGCGGLDLGAAEAPGGARLAWCADPDPHVRTVLAARMPGVGQKVSATSPGSTGAKSRRWTWSPRAGRARTSPPPAGACLQHGANSGLWRHIPPAVAALRPAMVVLENVAALRWHGGGFARVLADLASIGYDCLWTTLRASDVGAAHQRERVFLLAVPAARQPGAAGTARRCPPVSGHAQRCWPRAGIASHGCVRALALPAPQAASRGSPPLLPTPQARDHHGAQLPEQRRAGGHQVNLNDVARGLAENWQRDSWGAYEPAIRRWESITGRPAPPPAAPGPSGRTRMTAALPEFLLGFPDGWGTAVAGLPYAAQIQILGNAVAPRQTAAAVGQLAPAAAIMPAPSPGCPDSREADRAAPRGPGRPSRTIWLLCRGGDR